MTLVEQRELAVCDPIATAHEVARVAAVHAPAVDAESAFPLATLAELKRGGLMGLLVPEEYGGLGYSYSTMVDVARILGGSCLSTGLIWAMHCQQVATIVDHAPVRLRRRVLSRVARDGAFIGSVTSERVKGGHLLSAHAPLTWTDNAAIVERDAPTVTGGAHADCYLITMRRSEDRPPSDVVLVFADRDQLDIQVTSRWTPLGMRGTDSVGMTLRGRVPADQVLDPQRGFEHIAVTTMIPVGHIGWAAAWLGAAQGALGRLIDIWRDPSGRNSSNLQSDLFAAHLGRIRMQIDAIDAYVRQTLDEYESWHKAWLSGQVDSVPRRLNIHINNLKTLAAELSFSAVDQLVQLAGLQHGYLRNSRARLEQTFRDLRAASLMYANDRLLVANGKLTLLDHDLLGPAA